MLRRDNNIRILMLGNSESGKTTYMSSAYGLLQKPLYGFTVRAIDSSTHSWLIHLYNNLQIRNIYPARTDKRTTYAFNLFYQGQSIINFEWKDIMGGIIDQKGSEVKAFVNDISTSDALMMFFEGEALLNNISSRTRLRRISNLISNNLDVIDSDDFYITILITKYDCICDADLNDVINPLMDFINMAEENEKIHVSVVPVACTKNELLHVDLPLLTILYGGIVNDYLSKANELKYDVKKVEELQESAGILDDIISWLIDEKSNRELAQSKIQEAVAKYEILEKIKDAAKHLGNFIDEYEFFKATPKFSTNDDVFFL